jgi:signal-transduction protein with cAMP-binding, CBS, and nucleotidyltransferase domain
MNLRVLTSVKLFSKLSEPQKKKLAQSFDFERYSNGAQIIVQGEKGSKFYILKDGSAKVMIDVTVRFPSLFSVFCFGNDLFGLILVL